MYRLGKFSAVAYSCHPALTALTSKDANLAQKKSNIYLFQAV